MSSQTQNPSDPASPSFYSLFTDIPALALVDIGAALSHESPPYQPLLRQPQTQVTGFEPEPTSFQALQKLVSSQFRILPYALGDGQRHTLYICAQPNMSSLLEPDPLQLAQFDQFAQWGRVVDTLDVDTRRLDEVAEIQAMDYLKLDTQGSEVMILESAQARLKQTLVIHIEVQFMPFYKAQPLFSDLDMLLRTLDFSLHQFQPLVSGSYNSARFQRPVFSHWSQLLWADAVYIRPVTDWPQLSSKSLFKLAAIMHEVYGSYDLTLRALELLDTREQAYRSQLYLKHMAPL